MSPVALLVPGAAGVGSACRARLAERGLAVAVLADRSPGTTSPAGDPVGDPVGDPADAMVVATDLADEGAVDRALDTVHGALGEPGVLVTTVDVAISGTWWSEDWYAVADRRLRALFVTTRAAADVLVKNGGGRVVVVADHDGPMDDDTEVGVLLSGVTAFARTLARELAPFDVAVSLLAPPRDPGGDTTAPGGSGDAERAERVAETAAALAADARARPGEFFLSDAAPAPLLEVSAR